MTAAVLDPETTPSRAWVRDGLCVAAPDPDLWFPEAGQRNTAAEAKAVCRACPVISDCLAYAVALGIRHGVWGGTVPEERISRKAVRRPRPVSAATRARKTKAERERRSRVRAAAAARDSRAEELPERERVAGSTPETSEQSPGAEAAR